MQPEILDYVTVQAGTGESSDIMYLTTVKNPENPNRMSLAIYKELVSHDLSEDEMIETVDSMLTSFESYNKIESPELFKEYREQIEATLSENVATSTGRGPANTRYKNSHYYKGDQLLDSPVIVSEFNGKYAVFKHPNFENYGFILDEV